MLILGLGNSCTNQVGEIKTSTEKEIDIILSSKELETFKGNFSSYYDNLDFDNIRTEILSENETLYQIFAKMTDTNIGVLDVIFYKDGNYKIFFENKILEEKSENVTIQYFSIHGNLVLELSAIKDKLTNIYSLELSDKFKASKVSSCTGDCYKMAKDACNGDGDCALLCDALDIFFGSCTVAIATACLATCIN